MTRKSYKKMNQEGKWVTLVWAYTTTVEDIV